MAIPSGDIYLLKNVPLTATYEHTIDFKDRDEQFNYFYGFIKSSITKYTYIRKEREFIAVELPIKDLDDVNYMLFRAADGERLYYAFVTDKVYTNPTTTTIFYSIDVMQTFQFDYKWNASYIRQAHVDRWTAEHKPIYSKTDEGLDYGTEYSVESAYRIEQSSRLRWLLVTFKDYSPILDSGYATETGYFDGAGSSFACALVPVVLKDQSNPAQQPTVNVNPSSATIVAAGEGMGNTISTHSALLQGMSNGILGEYIQSISLLTYNPFIVNERYSGNLYTVDLNNVATYGMSILTAEGTGATTGRVVQLLIIRSAPKEVFNNLLARADWNIGLTDTLPTSAEWDEVKKNPYTTPRDKRFESKLLCSPYRYNLLTDWRNAPVVFKNEYMTTDKIELYYSFALSFNAPFRFWIKDYKRDPEGRYTSLTQPNAPDFPILSDAYYAYMLENKNTIQANLTNAIINGSTGVISGAISGGSVGGAWGAAAGAVTGLASGALNIQAHIRSENAKQADIRNKPDTVINSNDSSFNLVDNNSAVTFYRMRICCENEEIIGEIFNISGYKVNRVEIPNTRSRTRFNYIQTIGANITGSISQGYLTQIKEIYNNGITLWHYHPEHFKMLDYSYENIEVNLI